MIECVIQLKIQTELSGALKQYLFEIFFLLAKSILKCYGVEIRIIEVGHVLLQHS